eukprot:TRINITY_DN6119_c0_g3_i1.p1 TRINITY_DN6119_c0_g3~~TRINITY_DN6119_c0_g3_i1.p1  ORF type:complete len:227 (+),score=73.08 TRINITY_DN6119_c0_g3_i1:153-833(+)
MADVTKYSKIDQSQPPLDYDDGAPSAPVMGVPAGYDAGYPQVQPAQPVQQVHHVQETQQVVVQNGNFQSGICNCFDDMPACCDVIWCQPCVSARLWDSIENDRPNHINSGVCAMYGVTYGTAVALDMVVPGAGAALMSIPLFVVSMMQRMKLRAKMGIDANHCEDCLCAFWCTPCTMCQMHKESVRRGVTPGYCCCPQNTTVVVVQQNVQPTYVVQQQAPPATVYQ